MKFFQKWGLYRGSWDTEYLPFYFQGYRILSILLPGIWDTVQFQGYCYFSSKKIQIQSRNNNNINKNHLGGKAVCKRHGKFISTRTFRQNIMCRVNALIYSLASWRWPHTVYSGLYSDQTSLSIAWSSSDFSGVLFRVLNCIVMWSLSFLVELVAQYFYCVMAVCVLCLFLTFLRMINGQWFWQGHCHTLLSISISLCRCAT